MSGDAGLQGYVSRRYAELHAAGYSKSEAHSIAFQELRQLEAQRRAQQIQIEQEDPYNTVVFGQGGVL